MNNGRGEDLHTLTNVNNVDFSRCDKLAEQLPLSKVFRPSWDLDVISRLGFRDIDIRYLDSEDFTSTTEEGVIHSPVNFALCARLPYSNVSFDIGSGFDQLEPIENMIDDLTDDIKSVWAILSNKDCIKLLISMYSVDITIGQAAELLNCSYPLASHDMKKLKDAGFADSYRLNGEKLYYLTHKDIVNDLCIMTNLMSGKHIRSKGS